MPFRQPADTDPEAWYAAARRIDQARLTNEAFQSTLWSTSTAPMRSGQRLRPLCALVNVYGPYALRPSPVYPSLDVPPSSVHSAPRSPEARSVCTVQRSTYGRRHHLEDAPCTSARMLLMRRAQSSRKGLSLPSRCPEVNRGATGRIDRRFNGLERCSSRRESWLLSGGGFCLMRCYAVQIFRAIK